MPTFQYEAFTRSGKAVRGRVEADSDTAAMRQLAHQGLVTKRVSAQAQAAAPALFGLGARGKRPGPKDVALFTKQLAVMLRSGLDVAEALGVLEEALPNPRMQKVVHQVGLDILKGIPLSRALAVHDRVFGEFVVEMVRTGEATGQLEEVLSRVSVQLDKNLRMAAAIKKAMMYPMVTLSISIIAVVVMMALVVPMFVEIIDGLNAEMPALTQLVVGVSDFMKANLLLIVVAAAVGVVAFRRWRQTEAGAERFDTLMLRVPVVGAILQKSAVTKFTSTLGFCVQAGLDILGALDVAKRVAGVVPVEKALDDVRANVRDGVALSASLAQFPDLFPKLVPGIVRVGESSGELHATLYSIASYYESEVDDLTGSLSSVLEPVMMIVLGGLIGTVVIAMMLPMVSAMQSLG
jgi:type IV pilus assembly protein PilC